MALIKNDNLFRILIYVSWVFLLFVGIYDLFLVPYRSIVWFGSFLVLAFFYFKFDYIPKYVHFLLSLAFILNVFGELFFEWYYVSDCFNKDCASSYYDKILHFLNPFIICVFLFFLLKPRIKDVGFLPIFCVFATIALGVAWEIIEYGFDKIFGALMQGVFAVDKNHLFATGMIVDRMYDTTIDLILNFAGGFIFWLFTIFRSHKRDLWGASKKKN